MWKSIPPWLLPVIPLIPFAALVVLQSTGASPVLQKAAFFLFIGAIVLVIFVIRVRKRDASSIAVAPSLKKVILNFSLWLVAVFVLALAWANGYANWGIAALVLWTVVLTIINWARKREANEGN
jgi:predicted MFS family arabinose efflux permease